MERIIALFDNLDSEIDSCLIAILHRFVDIGSIVIDFSDGQGSKFVDKIIIGHEESAIIVISVIADSLLF